jgi:hypothetical protein
LRFQHLTNLGEPEVEFRRENGMRTTLAVLAAVAMSALPLRAAEAPTHAEIRQQFYQVTNDIRRAVDRMPESNYDFKPAPGMRSFRDLVAHISDVQNEICGAVFNDRKAKFMKSKTTSKADMAEALGTSFTACYQAFAELSPENAAAKVSTPMGSMTRLGALVRRRRSQQRRVRLHGRLPSSEGSRAPIERSAAGGRRQGDCRTNASISVHGVGGAPRKGAPRLSARPDADGRCLRSSYIRSATSHTADDRFSRTCTTRLAFPIVKVTGTVAMSSRTTGETMPVCLDRGLAQAISICVRPSPA